MGFFGLLSTFIQHSPIGLIFTFQLFPNFCRRSFNFCSPIIILLRFSSVSSCKIVRFFHLTSDQSLLQSHYPFSVRALPYYKLYQTMMIMEIICAKKNEQNESVRYILINILFNNEFGRLILESTLDGR